MNIHSEDNDLLPFSLLASSNFPTAEVEIYSESFLTASKTDNNRPVTRLELIAAIAKLYVINDGSDSLSTILNNL